MVNCLCRTLVIWYTYWLRGLISKEAVPLRWRRNETQWENWFYQRCSKNKSAQIKWHRPAPAFCQGWRVVYSLWWPMYFVNSVDDTSFVTAIKCSNVVELLCIWLQWGGLEWGVLCSCVWTSFVPHTLSKTKIYIKNYHRGNCRKSNVFSIQALKKKPPWKKEFKTS